MKTRIPVVLALAAALALAACAPAHTADAPQNVQTAETAPAQETAPEPQTAGPAGAFLQWKRGTPQSPFLMRATPTICWTPPTIWATAC